MGAFPAFVSDDVLGFFSALLTRHCVYLRHNRLERIYESDPTINANLVEILKKEADDGIARKVSSCTRAMVWLTRSMDFTVALLDKLVKDPGQSMEQAVEESYNITLRPWHGWISSAAYKVALKLVPERKNFINLLMTEDKDHDMLTQEIESLIALLLPLLDQIHSILIRFRCDRLKSA
ncbi:Glycolipid transfer protein domain [Macleaya cordata]|uniref:Glycolipid transfer protein domain n=1 Tax=Macleaya cordata TaxID=56857 RepID=A0A200PZA9_MACCD|nr:Glycolipid transfer protein domain [Macleaya cordata]